MKYLVLKGTVIGGAAVKAGDVVEVPESEVSALIGINRIAPVAEKATKTVDRAVGLDEETKPKRRTRAKKKAD
jgi:hypothetical protein